MGCDIADDRLLVTQKQAAELLSVSRVTIWRMTKDCVFHPVEILPGPWRYRFRELAALALMRTAVRTYSADNTLLYTESTPRDERSRLTAKTNALGSLSYEY